jgi:hypothetical protein
MPEDSETAMQPAAAAGEPDRLMIMSMELENFKSYANTVKIGPFDKSMTSVVGPNGSGKSNVIDAMLFVFGFAAKNMRQSKSTDLIHKSEAYPDLQYAKVTVFFARVVDLPDGKFRVVDGSEFNVSREVKKVPSTKGKEDGGISTYRVNNKGSSWTEVGSGAPPPPRAAHAPLPTARRDAVTPCRRPPLLSPISPRRRCATCCKSTASTWRTTGS